VVQVGAPLEIYDRPATRFVSDFIGDSNLIEASARPLGAGRAELVTEDGLKLAAVFPEGTAPGQRVTLAVRPERVRLLADTDAACDNVLAGTVESVNFQGDSILYRVACGAGRFLLALQPNDRSAAIRTIGAPVRAGWNQDDGVILTE
jgi:ABC-type Fe3+/spermidine/putrescine transport system ATPase subunit